MAKAQAKAKAKRSVEVPREEKPTIKETAKPKGDGLPIVERVALKCPACGSVRSRLVRTEPGEDGRMELRRCKGCLRAFKVWDKSWQRER